MGKWVAVLVSAVLMLAVLFTGCSAVDVGPVVSKDFDFKDFSNVTIGSAFDVEIVPSSTFSVNVTAPENMMKYIKVAKSGGTLEVSLQWGWRGWTGWTGDRPKVRVAMPELYILELSGAARGTARGFKSIHDSKIVLSGASSLDADIEAYDMNIEVSGASRLTGNLKANNIKLRESGASRIQLVGSGNNMDLEVSGASQAQLDGFTVNDARVEVSGASRASIAPTGKMDVSLSGASSLEYSGNPTLRGLDISGASTMRKKS